MGFDFVTTCCPFSPLLNLEHLNVLSLPWLALRVVPRVFRRPVFVPREVEEGEVRLSVCFIGGLVGRVGDGGTDKVTEVVWL